MALLMKITPKQAHAIIENLKTRFNDCNDLTESYLRNAPTVEQITEELKLCYAPPITDVVQ